MPNVEGIGVLTLTFAKGAAMIGSTSDRNTINLQPSMVAVVKVVSSKTLSTRLDDGQVQKVGQAIVYPKR
jgi:hypothetical protein